MVFYNQKSFVRRRLHRCRLRHKIHAIKTRPNNPLRFLQRKKSFQRYLSNDLTCAARKTTFRTRKRFHNKQYTPKSKDQPFESDRTHFYVRFNNGNYENAPSDHNFFFLTKSQPFNKKQPTGTINQIKQSEKTRPRNHSIKSTQRQTQQAITTKCNVFEYYNIANSNGFRANRKYAFHKNSTQIHKTKQHNLYFEVTILQTRKSKTLYF